MKPLILLVSAIVLVTSTASVSGQSRTSTKRGISVADLKKQAGGAITPEMLERLNAKLAEVDDANTEATSESPRLLKLKQLQFDRTPSAILKAWSSKGPATPLKHSAAAPPANQRSGRSPQRSIRSQLNSLPPSIRAQLPANLPIPAAGSETADTADAASPELEAELALLQRNVTLGNWLAVKTYLAGLPEEEGKAGYQQMLTSLKGRDNPMSKMFRMRDPEDKEDPTAGTQNLPAQQMLMQNMQQQLARSGGLTESNVFSAADVHGLALAAPVSLEDAHLTLLGGILEQAIRGGSIVDHFITLMKPAKSSGLSQRQAAQILFHAEQEVRAGEFLPTIAEASEARDRQGLNLLARHFLALHGKEKKAVQLEQAWLATQAVLGLGEMNENPPFAPESYEGAGMTSGIAPAFASANSAFGIAGQVLAKQFSLLPPMPQTEKEEALRRAVELAKRVRKELGEAWLAESFTSELQRGKEILATIGSVSSQALQQHMQNAELRLQQLELQRTAVGAFLKAAPEKSSEWRDVLSVLAGNWLREAEITYQFAQDSTLSPYMQRDRFGNIYYLNEDMYNPFRQQQRQVVNAISTGDMLENRPNESWLAHVEKGLKPKLATVYAQLFLKVGEEAKAFPYIEELSLTHPKKAEALANEFIRVWTKNHDPNSESRQTNPYMFIYGFEQRAQGIPLTRSKQERNLEELAKWVKRLRELNTGALDEELLANAFTTCHSTAEVYRLEAMETVFGPLDGLKPMTLAELAQKMRANLAGLWRNPALQDQNKTNRKQKDIQQEVQRGYAVARTTVENCLKQFPDDWSLHLALAAIEHDENSYQQELAKSSEFTQKQRDALAGFKRAADLYAATVTDLSEDDETTQVYEQWFYASLGACDLGALSEEKLPDLTQPPVIREAIESLPGHAAERHMSKFANLLFTRMSAVKPASKFQYLRSGFEIVGDHKHALEARKVYDYYKDLVNEIKLEAAIDGSDAVGCEKPFGVFVNIRHTREIERESGGFGRYLQNQNSSYYFSYNYGRPTADYRDKFQEIVNQALQEHFEVLSVTFHSDKVHSRALPEYGWRVTPYAYLLLKARGPEVDKLPSLHIDMDFMDTSGYVVIPIPSAPVPMDAATAKADPRPIRKLEITQILDERQADEGKLVLDVKAAGLGLIPDLSQVLDLEPDGFDIEKLEDQGVSVSKFDEEDDEIAVLTERTGQVTLRASPNQVQLPIEFTFGTAQLDPAKMIYQRYDDADLVPVEQRVALQSAYGRRNWPLIIGAIAGGAIAVIALFMVILKLRQRRPDVASQWAVPSELTPFTVIGLLEQIRDRNHMNSAKAAELQDSIVTLEKHYFSGANGDSRVDLKKIAEHWVQQAN